MLHDFLSRIDNELTRVQVAVVLGGNGGCNQISMIMMDTYPETAPDLSLVLLASDGNLLQGIMAPKHVTEAQKKSIRTSMESGRHTFIPLTNT